MPDLRLVDLLGRCRIDAPVESQHSAGIMRLQPFQSRVRLPGSWAVPVRWRRRPCSETVPLTEQSKAQSAIPRARASLNDIFRPVRFIRLRDQAAALVDQIGNRRGQLGKRTRRQAMDHIRGFVAVGGDLSRLGERIGIVGRQRHLGGGEGCSQPEKREQRDRNLALHAEASSSDINS